MAAIQAVCHPQDGRQLGNGQIGLGVQRCGGPQLFIIVKILMVIFNHVGDNFTFPVGKADDLRGHDNAVGTFPQIHHADIFPAVMEQGGNAQQ